MAAMLVKALPLLLLLAVAASARSLAADEADNSSNINLDPEAVTGTLLSAKRWFAPYLQSTYFKYATRCQSREPAQSYIDS